MIEFAFGAASVLACEFLLAHWYLYRSKKAASPGSVVKAAFPIVQTIEDDATRAKNFFKVFQTPNTAVAVSVTPVPGTTPPTTTSGVVAVQSGV